MSMPLPSLNPDYYGTRGTKALQVPKMNAAALCLLSKAFLARTCLSPAEALFYLHHDDVETSFAPCRPAPLASELEVGASSLNRNPRLIGLVASRIHSGVPIHDVRHCILRIGV